MKLLVSGENLQVLMEIVNSLRNFDNIVTLRFTGSTMLLKATDAFDRNIEHKFEPPFYVVVTDSGEERETKVTTKDLLEAFETIELFGGTSVSHTKCYLEIVNKLIITMEWSNWKHYDTVVKCNFEPAYKGGGIFD